MTAKPERIPLDTARENVNRRIAELCLCSARHSAGTPIGAETCLQYSVDLISNIGALLMGVELLRHEAQCDIEARKAVA